ncbi:VOC family protein [Candidatus Poriferisocius sp.]|uniref:VOC family protein n=1 Tax=Candidatus Poriferisocius sp. TaxID=3101276 RepID=UPI003B5B1AD3
MGEETKPVVNSIVHVQVAIPAGGEDEARKFYGGLLGLKEIPKPPELAKRDGCWFELPEGTCGQLHLGAEQDFRPAKKSYVAFVVSDLTELAETAQSQGYEVARGTADGIEQVYIYDPFGNRLEFCADD